LEVFELKRKTPDDLVISLAGNPNVGKSSIFNSLTGMRQHTGNWPGKTVGIAQGMARFQDKNFLLVDLPGTYSLFAHSAEEEVARDFIKSKDSQATIVVCDATNLERNLNLTLQILQLTTHVVVAVNLMDEAKKKNIEVDLGKLSELLGVPVVGTSAARGQGLEELMEKVHQVATAKVCPNLHLIGRLKQIRENPETEGRQLVEIAGAIAAQTVTYHKEDYDRFERKLDKILTQKATGIPIMVFLLFGIFWFTIVGASGPSALLARFFAYIGGYLEGWALYLHLPPFLHGLLFDGIYKVLTTVISVMFPPMAIFFPIFTLLEDFGYLPRVAFNLDGFYQKANTCGKQALTMCMGFGCNSAAIVGTRIIDSPRERLIAIITNNFVPCNGRFPILISVISMFFVAGAAGFASTVGSALLLTAVILLGIGTTFAVSRILSQTILKGLPSSFALELPPYRRPMFKQVLVRSLLDRTLFVLWRAIVVAAPAGAVLYVLANLYVGDISIYGHLTGFLNPFARLMGFDGNILLAFILGIPANEIVIPIMVMGYMSGGTLMELGSATELQSLLLANGWTWLTAVNVILFTIFHWPCGTATMSIFSETKSSRWTWFSFALPKLMGIAITVLTTFFFNLWN